MSLTSELVQKSDAESPPAIIKHARSLLPLESTTVNPLQT